MTDNIRKNRDIGYVELSPGADISRLCAVQVKESASSSVIFVSNDNSAKAVITSLKKSGFSDFDIGRYDGSNEELLQYPVLVITYEGFKKLISSDGDLLKNRGLAILNDLHEINSEDISEITLFLPEQTQVLGYTKTHLLSNLEAVNAYKLYGEKIFSVKEKVSEVIVKQEAQTEPKPEKKASVIKKPEKVKQQKKEKPNDAKKAKVKPPKKPQEKDLISTRNLAEDILHIGRENPEFLAFITKLTNHYFDEKLEQKENISPFMLNGAEIRLHKEIRDDKPLLKISADQKAIEAIKQDLEFDLPKKAGSWQLKAEFARNTLHVHSNGDEFVKLWSKIQSHYYDNNGKERVGKKPFILNGVEIPFQKIRTGNGKGFCIEATSEVVQATKQFLGIDEVKEGNWKSKNEFATKILHTDPREPDYLKFWEELLSHHSDNKGNEKKGIRPFKIAYTEVPFKKKRAGNKMAFCIEATEEVVKAVRQKLALKAFSPDLPKKTSIWKSNQEFARKTLHISYDSLEFVDLWKTIQNHYYDSDNKRKPSVKPLKLSGTEIPFQQMDSVSQRPFCIEASPKVIKAIRHEMELDLPKKTSDWKTKTELLEKLLHIRKDKTSHALWNKLSDHHIDENGKEKEGIKPLKLGNTEIPFKKMISGIKQRKVFCIKATSEVAKAFAEEVKNLKKDKGSSKPEKFADFRSRVKAKKSTKDSERKL